MERLTLYTHAVDLDYLSAQLAAQYGPLTQAGSLEWLAGLPAAPGTYVGRDRALFAE